MPLQGVELTPKPDPASQIAESVELLNRLNERVGSRIRFFDAVTTHIRDVIVPALEDFVGKFGSHARAFKVEISSQPLNPEVTLTFKWPQFVHGVSALEATFKYVPCRHDALSFEVERPGRRTKITEYQLSELDREYVLRDISAAVLEVLKEDLDDL